MELQALAQRGLTFGLHLVAGAARWADFRAAIRDVFGTRLELRLGDPNDSEVDRKLAQLVPTGRPGRGLVAAKLHFLAALPRVDGRRRRRTPSASGSRTSSSGPARRGAAARARSCACCPSASSLAGVREQVERTGSLDGPTVYLAVDERDLAPVGLDIDREPHLLAFGDSRSGKSALLRTYAREVMRTRTAAGGAGRRRRLPALAARGGPRRLPAALPHQRDAGGARDRRAGGVPPAAAARPGRDARPAAQPVLVDRRRGLRRGRRLRPGRHPVRLAGPAAGAAAGPGPRRRAAPRAGAPLRRRRPGALRAGHPEPARPGDAGPAALRQPRRGPARSARPKPRKAVPGRGQLVTRDRGVEVVQTAWTDPTL